MKRVALLLALLAACALDTDEDVLDDTESEATVPALVTTLVDGQPIVISGASGSRRYFKIDLAAGNDQLVVYRNPTYAMADIYVKIGGLPSETSYSCKREHGDSTPCKITMPPAGTYYIMVLGQGSSGYTNVSLTADIQNPYGLIGNNTTRQIYNPYGIDYFWKMNVPSNVGSLSFTFTLDPNDDGAFDLVTKRGGFANEYVYDCKRIIDWNAFTATGTCTYTNPPAGTYYVGLLGNGAKVVGTFTARYQFALVPTDPPISTL